MILQPSKLVRTLGLPLVCLAMFSLGGGHWALLQSLAWGQMLWGYWQDNVPVAVAVEKTFSGDNPCSLCTSVQEGRQQEEKAPLTLSSQTKVEVFLVEFAGILPPRAPRDFAYPRLRDEGHAARRDAPPSPVPRSHLA